MAALGRQVLELLFGRRLAQPGAGLEGALVGLVRVQPVVGLREADGALADAEQMRETNIAAYGKERILAKADQIDLYLAQSGRMNPVSVDDIVREPGFSVIKAVRERQVFLVDEEMISRPTLGLIDGIAFVRSLLYPDYGQEGVARL